MPQLQVQVLRLRLAEASVVLGSGWGYTTNTSTPKTLAAKGATEYAYPFDTLNPKPLYSNTRTSNPSNTCKHQQEY